jgi:hypothetical protein
VVKEAEELEMSRKQTWFAVAVGLALTGGAGAVAIARGPGMACGPGMGHGAMGPGGMGNGADMQGIHDLFANRGSITRTVTEIPGGVRTLTETNDPQVVRHLQEHVQAMYRRLQEGNPINARDPLFAALFRNAKKIDARIEKTDKGVRVTETSSDPEVAQLIRRHAQVVNAFLANGMHEMMKSH